MANVERRAQFHNAAVTLEGGREELLEVRMRHAVTLDRQMILGIAFVVHVVWQIREDQISGSAVHQPRDISFVRSVAHQESVWPKRPQIARNADGRLGDVGNIVFVGQARGRFFRRQKPRQLFIVEANEAQIELCFPESLQLDAKALFIPRRATDCQLAVRNHQGATLRLGEMPEHDNGDFGHAVLAGRRNPGMTRDHVKIGVATDAAITVVYKTDGGVVRGTAENCASGGVVLVPRDPSLRRGFSRSGPCDSSDRYEVRAMRPGEYYAVAFAGKGPALAADRSVTQRGG